jgi:eukaryotic-like serine/threonine-protein kinase
MPQLRRGSWPAIVGSPAGPDLAPPPVVSPEPFTDLRPGVLVGEYVLDAWIGEGGFAEVWRATRVGSDARVAIKMVRRSYARDVEIATMVVDEARIAARLQHPNVARVCGSGDAHGRIYLALELIEGGSLAELSDAYRAASGGAMPPALSLHIVRGVARGLHAAHEARGENGEPLNVVHRDVSPQNVLLTEEGVPKLIDFGIARGKHRVAQRTRTGITKGKVSYMPPEQARAGAVDRRSDVWALGAVTYELLEGVPPVDGDSDFAVAFHIANEQPMRAPEAMTGAVRDVVLKALAYDPDERYSTAQAFCDALGEAAATLGLSATDADVASFRRKVLADAPRPPVSSAVETESEQPAAPVADPPEVAPYASASGVVLGATAPSRPSVDMSVVSDEHVSVWRGPAGAVPTVRSGQIALVAGAFVAAMALTYGASSLWSSETARSDAHDTRKAMVTSRSQVAVATAVSASVTAAKPSRALAAVPSPTLTTTQAVKALASAARAPLSPVVASGGKRYDDRLE